MSDLQAYEARRKERIAEARKKAQALMEKYHISPLGAERQIVERYSQEDLDAHMAALQVMYDEGGLG